MLLLSVLSLVFSTFEHPTAKIVPESTHHLSSAAVNSSISGVSTYRTPLPAKLTKQKASKVIDDMRQALLKHVPYAKNCTIREAAGIQSQGYIQKFKNGNINTVTPTVRKLYAYLQTRQWIRSC